MRSPQEVWGQDQMHSTIYLCSRDSSSYAWQTHGLSNVRQDASCTELSQLGTGDFDLAHANLASWNVDAIPTSVYVAA